MASRGGEHRRRRGGRGGHGYVPQPKRQASEQPNIDENSPVIQLFRGFQTELDSKHDKQERLVKLSRDITIDSKRAIFLLQRVTGNADDDKTLEEAEKKFEEIRNNKWRSVALELQNEDPYQYLRSYSPGLQEYVEGVSLWYYLKNDALINCQQIQDDLVFPKDGQDHGKDARGEGEPAKDQQDTTPAKSPSKSEEISSTVTSSTVESVEQHTTTVSEKPLTVEKESGDTPQTDKTEIKEKQCGSSMEETEKSEITVHVPAIEYILGVADLTGELMRMAISAVGKGHLEKPYKICDFMRIIYDSFLSYGNVSRELSRKMFTLKQSLAKVENACYMLQVRGSEVPKHMLVDVISASDTQYSGNMEEG